MLLYLAIIFIFAAVLLTISSRVRKAARAAFESETIDAGEFTIIKPEGFINPLKDESKFAFEAYSKDFGAGEAENMNQAEIFVSVFSDAGLDEVCKEVKTDEILSEEFSGQARLIKTSETLENIPAYNFYKIVESETRRKVYSLKFWVLQDALAEYQSRIDETLESFRLK